MNLIVCERQFYVCNILKKKIFQDFVAPVWRNFVSLAPLLLEHDVIQTYFSSSLTLATSSYIL